MFTAVREDFFACVVVGIFTIRSGQAFCISENSETNTAREECCDTGQLIDKDDLVVSFQ